MADCLQPKQIPLLLIILIVKVRVGFQVPVLVYVRAVKVNKDVSGNESNHLL